MLYSIEVKAPTGPLSTGQGVQVVNEELQAAMESSVNLVRNAILPLVPVNQGALRQGVQTELSGTPADPTGRVYDPLAYAVPVEAGSRPHFPPRAALELWVRRKLGVSEKDARSVAFLVARAISRRGTAARNFFRDGVAASRDQVAARFRIARDRIVARWGGAQ